MRSGQLRYALRKSERGGRTPELLCWSCWVWFFYFYFYFLCYEFSFLLSVEALNRERGIEQKKTAQLTRRELRGINYPEL